LGLSFGGTRIVHEGASFTRRAALAGRGLATVSRQSGETPRGVVTGPGAAGGRGHCLRESQAAVKLKPKKISI
jgi:hypothetical protein